MSLCLYRVLWTAGFCCVFSQYTCFPSTLTEASSRKSAQIPVMLQNPKKDPKENNFTFYTGLIRASEQFCSQITKQSQLELRDTVSLLELLKLYSYPCIVATRLSRCSYWRTNRYFFSLYLFESHRLKGMLCIIPLILFPSNHTVHKPLDSGWLVAFITNQGTVICIITVWWWLLSAAIEVIILCSVWWTGETPSQFPALPQTSGTVWTNYSPVFNIIPLCSV